MSVPILCLACGEEMNEWHNEIYECNECGNMIDSEIFDDEELNE
jgi:DNA-directed RNA polymerase subunit N (RpoN/RPB10)